MRSKQPVALRPLRQRLEPQVHAPTLSLCPTHLLLHLAQERPQRGVAPDELLDGAHDPHAVQRGLVVTEAGDVRQLVVAHLVGLPVKAQEARARVRVQVTGQGCAGLNLTPGQEAVAHR